MFVFVLIGVFALTSITLVLTGINVYRNVTDHAAHSVDQLLALSYVINKVHAGDAAGIVQVDSQDGVSILCLNEWMDDELYQSRIFYFDGALYEQYVLASNLFDPELGERITDIESFELLEMEPNLYRMSVRLSGGGEHTLHIALHSRQAR